MFLYNPPSRTQIYHILHRGSGKELPENGLQFICILWRVFAAPPRISLTQPVAMISLGQSRPSGKTGRGEAFFRILVLQYDEFVTVDVDKASKWPEERRDRCSSSHDQKLVIKKRCLE